LKRGLFLCAVLVAVSFLSGAGAGTRPAPGGRTVEVVVTLERPSLAAAMGLRARRSPSYARAIAADQTQLERRIKQAVPGARVRWRYRYVLNALAVVVPAGSVDRLASLRGVGRVFPSVRYRSLLDQSPTLINAPTLWGPTLSTAGQGMKIGIIDDGIDQAHRFFSPSGFAMPPGFPKGNTSFTTAKVIVARAFPPPGTKWKYADRPFDPLTSEHATHVAGIAAGDYGATQRGGRPVSGVAPHAYLGNYKVLTVPTPAVGLDGNSPEIVKGIDAAVADGMDVINLSLGEPEIDIDRDIVVQALNAAADAGVVPVVSAGNDFTDFGAGSISSPGNTPKAITAAAVTKGDEIAEFSSGGPSGIDLGFKPDVSAPGVNIFSSVPRGWDSFSGTSMAAPHIAGGIALLLQRHPSWTPAQVKSALALTGGPVWTNTRHTREALATREGGGLINLAAANNPLVFAAPTSVSFGLVPRGGSSSKAVALTDAGGGAGTWAVTIKTQTAHVGTTLSAPAAVSVPGSLSIQTSVRANGQQGETMGFVVLSRATTTRRFPFWLRVVAPQLGRARHTRLTRLGIYRGNTAGRSARVSCYRYPADPSSFGIAPCLRGPEQVFRVLLRRPAANFGVAVLSRGRGVRVQPRVVVAGNENRLTGYSALPLNLNPYLFTFQQRSPAAGAVRPGAGAYDVVFDTPSRRAAGRFSFRFWIGDTRPPRVRLLTPRVRAGELVVVRVSDEGAGVDPRSLRATLDGDPIQVRYAAGRLRIPTAQIRRGVHTLLVRASDYQEAKNMENSGPILPNTANRRLRFSVR
jgi:subtilisin family serine protease